MRSFILQNIPCQGISKERDSLPQEATKNADLKYMFELQIAITHAFKETGISKVDFNVML